MTASRRKSARRPTRRQLALIRGVAAGRSLTDAAIAAGYGRGVNRRSAAVQACQTLANPNVWAALNAAMARVGLTPQDTLKAIKDALRAEKVVTHEGRKIAAEKDHAMRLRAAELALRVHGFIGNLNRDETHAEGGSLAGLVAEVRRERERRGLPPIG